MQFIGEVQLGRLLFETQHGKVKEKPNFWKILSVFSNGHSRIAGPIVTVLRRGEEVAQQGGWVGVKSIQLVAVKSPRGRGFGNGCHVQDGGLNL